MYRIGKVGVWLGSNHLLRHVGLTHSIFTVIQNILKNSNQTILLSPKEVCLDKLCHLNPIQIKQVCDFLTQVIEIITNCFLVVLVI